MTHFGQTKVERAEAALAKSRVRKRKSRPNSLYEIESREADQKLAAMRRRKKPRKETP
jgi:hypothetical protein